MTLDLDLVSAAIPQQMATLGPDGRITYANRAFCDMFCPQDTSPIGQDLTSLLHESLREEFSALVHVALKGEPAETIRGFSKPGDGRAWTSSFVPLPNGGVLFVTEYPGDSYQHPPRVQNHAQRLLAFMNFAPIGMLFSHFDGRVLEANDTFLNLIGYTREELKNGTIHWDSLTPPEFLELDYIGIEQAKQQGYSKPYEKDYIRKNGERVHIIIGFVLSGEKRDEAVAYVVDLTALKAAEEQIKQLNAELEERVALRTAELEVANRELEAFCYSVSHDLRAPLRSIDGFAYALHQDYGDQLDSEAADFIARIRASVKRMDELISALLSLSRLTRVELNLETLNLSELASQTAKELVDSNPDRSLEIQIQPGLSTRADRRLMQVALENLFGNAVKFTARAAVTRIEFGFDGSCGAFFVRDNGVGFDSSDSTKLFQPFERLHSPREFAGSGIGLATVQRIIRRHGGQIWAHSEVDKGATFYFTL